MLEIMIVDLDVKLICGRALFDFETILVDYSITVFLINNAIETMRTYLIFTLY